MDELLRVEHLTKVYPNGFVANQDISFSVNRNEIHALVGENGAGKTTLMKMLFGMENYQEGSIFLNGQKLEMKSALDAIKSGIGMIHQHFMLVPSLSIAENMVLGIEPVKGAFFDSQEAVRRADEAVRKYGFDLDVTQKVCDISVGSMQKVEILKALIRGIQVLIMDEPTAVLTPQETRELFEQLYGLKKQGYAVIFISHKLEEIMELCDRVTILRKGHCLGTYEICNLTQESISGMMIGREVDLHFHKETVAPKEEILRVSKLIVVGDDGKRKVDQVSFGVRCGEILGIAGVEGSGQTELAAAITGTLEYHAGSITLKGAEVREHTVRQLREMGMANIHEDRMKIGAAVNQSIRDNIIADRYYRPEFCRRFFTNKKAVDEFVNRCIEEFEISCDSASQPVRMLSGGNIQKVIVAREFTSGCQFIVANQPTRGIDVGTTEMIRKKLIWMSHEKDVATLLISADLKELLEVSDRILVMYKGKLAAMFSDVNEVTEDILGEYMLGIRTMNSGEMGEC